MAGPPVTASSTDPSGPPEASGSDSLTVLTRLQVAGGIALIVVAAALSGLIEVLLVPLYIGATLFPITILFAVASNIALPVLTRRLVDSALVAAIPVVVWILLVLRASQTGPGGDVVLPGSGAVGVVSVVFMLSGLTAGVVTVVRHGMWRAPR
ncbi:hypothetical protein SAMN05444157_1284 [Frankineae bacterium MT45]|nr:hypothetical protein SAMN05444157_1284 [Frankineae bacterium MT45]